VIIQLINSLFPKKNGNVAVNGKSAQFGLVRFIVILHRPAITVKRFFHIGFLGIVQLFVAVFQEIVDPAGIQFPVQKGRVARSPKDQRIALFHVVDARNGIAQILQRGVQCEDLGVGGRRERLAPVDVHQKPVAVQIVQAEPVKMAVQQVRTLEFDPDGIQVLRPALPRKKEENEEQWAVEDGQWAMGGIVLRIFHL